jgi:hypothetical protein
MSILKDRIRPLDPSSNQVFLEPDRRQRPRAEPPEPFPLLHAVTRDAEGLGTRK